MTRTTSLTSLLAVLALSAAPAVAQASGQVSGGPLDETPEGGLEEAAARYFAPPADEEPMAAIDLDETRIAGAVALAIALGRVEEGIDACRTLREEMQELIGDSYGSYSVNPGWLRTYQNCLLRRGEEADAIGEAIEARQRELIARTGAAETEDEADSAAALRAADLMARLSARQSGVRRDLRQEGRMQQAFVRYYNTGKRPDVLDEAPRRAGVPVPADERPLGAPAPIRIDPPARRAPGPVEAGEAEGPIQTDILLPTDPARPVSERPSDEATGTEAPLGGAIIMPEQPNEPTGEPMGEAPLSRVPGPREAPKVPATNRVPAKASTRATGAPMPLRPAGEVDDGIIGQPSSPE